ncbi:MAG: hypothetical protein WCP55_24805, partial [Lentisphaerota bacterium]
MPIRKMYLSALAVGLAGTAFAADLAKPLTEDFPSGTSYVTVPLDDYAHDFKEQSFTSKKITIDKIPFALVDKPGVNNLFLKTAEWSEWKTDPSAFYAKYDVIPKEKTDQRPILQIPVADYTAVYLLAATDTDQKLTPVVSFRIGSIRGAGGKGRVVYHDFSSVVPRTSEKTGADVIATFPAEDGNLFLLRIPLGKAIAQDFKEQSQLDVDVTKELRLAIRRPDPCRFQIRPLGLPSGVRIYGMTFERSPVQMEVTSDESGHVFNQPQIPTFHVTLQNFSASSVNCSVVGSATDYSGINTVKELPEVKIAPGSSTKLDLPLSVSQLGYHDLSVALKIGKTVVLQRDTAFALLPADTRKFRNESPFGTWDFCGQHHTPADPNIVGPLYVKAGLRYGMFS